MFTFNLYGSVQIKEVDAIRNRLLDAIQTEFEACISNVELLTAQAESIQLKTELATNQVTIMKLTEERNQVRIVNVSLNETLKSKRKDMAEREKKLNAVYMEK